MKSRIAAVLVIVAVVSAIVGATVLKRSRSAAVESTAGQTNSPSAHPRQESPKALEVVEAKYVCMINNQRFEKVQISVEVEGRTYYGCCEMCKTTLRDKPESRTATDPVSGKPVDKAKAVIGANQAGEVFYFENAENLKRFKAGAR